MEARLSRFSTSWLTGGSGTRSSLTSPATQLLRVAGASQDGGALVVVAQVGLAALGL